ncbi:oxidoreductase-like protein [Anaeramoeba flamelloides]|uniref:Oxidoreductase-like protein n=1 Tax=Anaeramoeba flamelloides TaxID=1746091 RepID=A0ABQ8XRB5_9EUKA|nr:oxidoreductase-like protein [Anaeramoeba flamelloides]
MLTDLEEHFSQQIKLLETTTNKKNLGYYEFYKIIGEYSQVESVESEEQYTTKLGKIVNLKQFKRNLKQIVWPFVSLLKNFRIFLSGPIVLSCLFEDAKIKKMFEPKIIDFYLIGKSKKTLKTIHCQIVEKIKQILNNQKDLLIIKLPTSVLYCFETNDRQFPIFRLNFVGLYTVQDKLLFEPISAFQVGFRFSDLYCTKNFLKFLQQSKLFVTCFSAKKIYNQGIFGDLSNLICKNKLPVNIHLTNLRNLKTKEITQEMLNCELQKKNSKSFYGFYNFLEKNQENENKEINEKEKEKEKENENENENKNETKQKKPKTLLNLFNSIFIQISNKNFIQNILESLKKDKNEEQISINYHIKDHNVNQDSILDMFDSKNEIENNSGNNFFLSDEISNHTKKNLSKTKNKNNNKNEKKKKNNNNNNNKKNKKNKNKNNNSKNKKNKNNNNNNNNQLKSKKLEILVYRSPNLKKSNQILFPLIKPPLIQEFKKNFIFWCYICKKRKFPKKLEIAERFRYSNEIEICSECKEFNTNKKKEIFSISKCTDTLKGKVAIVTGGRIKIGFATAIGLLYHGCTVIATTRFPGDAYSRFEKDPFYKEWENRLIIYPLDFRHFTSILKFVDYIKKNFTKIDFLINNAAQTVKYPPAYYKHLVRNEKKKITLGRQKKIISIDNKPFKIKGNELVEQFHSKELNLNVNSLPLSVLLSQVQTEENEQTDFCKEFPDPDHVLDDNLIYNQMKKEIETKQEIQEKQKLEKKEKIDFNKIINDLDDFLHEDENIMNIQKLKILKEQLSERKPYEDIQKDLRNQSSWTMRLDEVTPIEIYETMLINYLAPTVMINQFKDLMSRDKNSKLKSVIVNVTSKEGKFASRKSSSHPHTNSTKAALNMITRTTGHQYYEHFNILLLGIDPGWINHVFDKSSISSCPLNYHDGATRIIDPILNPESYISGKIYANFQLSEW